MRDVWSGTTRCASLGLRGAPGNGESEYPALSADGRHVVFWSHASDLVADDTNGTWDVFERDLASGVTRRVSIDSGGAQSQGDASCYERPPALSADGRFVAFVSQASDLVPGDTNGAYDVFVHDCLSGGTLRVSVDSSGAQSDSRGSFEGYPSLSADGRYVAFFSNAKNLVPGDTNIFGDAFVHDCLTGATTRVSVSSAGLQAAQGGQAPTISADGRYVVFRSTSPDLVPGDTDGFVDFFLRDLVRGSTTRFSVDSAGHQGNSMSLQASLSSAARCVAFSSQATNLVPGDTNGSTDVFLRRFEPTRAP